MIDPAGAESLVGQDVRSTDGERIGSVGQVFFDDVRGTPDWVTVLTGLFGTKETFVPLFGAEAGDDGLVVPYSRAMVKGAPHLDVDQHLGADEEGELYRYYGVEYDTEDAALPVDATDGSPGVLEMTLTGEAVHVGTEDRPVTRVRLRKYVVTEYVATVVPVTREEIHIERVPDEEDLPR